MASNNIIEIDLLSLNTRSEFSILKDLKPSLKSGKLSQYYWKMILIIDILSFG